VYTYSPEVVDQQVEDTQDNDQHNGAKLRLEANDNHNASHKAQHCDNDPPDAPFSAEDKSNEEEDQENTTGKLEVHLTILLINLWQTCEGLGLSYPGIGQDHQETTHNGQVAEEEVKIKNEAISERLCDDHSNESSNSIIRVLSGDDKGGAGAHGDDVDNEEQVRETPWNCRQIVSFVSRRGETHSILCL
jgi:hypothetical protein